MTSNNVTAISIIGHTGVVGKRVYEWFKKSIYPKYKVMGLSIDKQTYSWDEINRDADYIFIAVPTPFDWKKKEYKTNIVEEVLDKIVGKKKVIIKSTVVPGTTDILQKKYPELLLFFNPEFLSEKTAEADFINPDRQIIGYTNKSYCYAQEILHLLPQSPYDVIMNASEAEVCKYVNNFHGALMVIFSNFFYDVCEKLGSNYETVKKASIASKWVGSPMGRMYWEVFHKGKRGYGGTCFPKDINSLIKWCKENKINTEIIEATQKANVRMLKSQDLNEQVLEKNNGNKKHPSKRNSQG